MSTQCKQLVANIVSCRETQDLLHAHGLKAHSITWEDTGRSKGSCWGPNISDMTLITKDNGRQLMPVIRKPNFSDITNDVPIESFQVRVGNEEKGEDKIVSLKEYISNLQNYCPDMKDATNLYDSRDTVVLTSTQCCVLPVPKDDKTEFTVQLFNYQSSALHPAVLAILVTKEGTSAQVLTEHNQKLFFNNKGRAHWFSVERLESVRKRQNVAKTRVESFKEMTHTEKMDNTIMMIQIPLKVKEQMRGGDFCCSLSAGSANAFSMEWASANEACCMADGDSSVLQRGVSKKKKGHGMDMGQLGLGSEEGGFVGTKGLKLERDTRFPIRCTYQYYRVTDENYITESNVKDIAEQLNQVLTVSVATGSLVVNEDTKRTTEPDLSHPVPTDNPKKSDPWGVASMSTF